MPGTKINSNIKKVAVFTSGGDAPGMNAAVRAVVRGAVYHGIEVCGIIRGYDGLIKGDIIEMDGYSVSNIIQRGGTILKSARSEEFRTADGRKKAFDNVKKFEIDGIVAIGGNGTFTGAKLFHSEYDVPTVGVPGTIDNDLYGTDFTSRASPRCARSFTASRRAKPTSSSARKSWRRGITSPICASSASSMAIWVSRRVLIRGLASARSNCCIR